MTLSDPEPQFQGHTEGEYLANGASYSFHVLLRQGFWGRPINHRISETVQDRTKVTIDH